MYRPLDHSRKEIRLLVVQPRRDDELLRCSFDYAVLASPERPQYETISYVWADETKRGDIEVDGTLISVPLSALVALRCIRRLDIERVVWIDAVCINQGDNDERGLQVAMMADIYMGGICNLAILDGDEFGQGDLAARAIEQIKERALEEFGDEDKLSNMWVNELPEKLPPLSIDITRDSVDVIDLLHINQMMVYLMLDPYRDRGVCQKIMDTSNLTNLREIAYLCRYPPDMLIYMDELLDTASSFDVKDARDRVYGMLGLFRRGRDLPELPQFLVPDYTKDPNIVIRDATRFAIVSKCYMDVLWRTQRRMVDGINVEKPSWVPSLRQPYREGELCRNFSWDNAAHGAGHFRAELAPFSSVLGDGILTVKGLALDTVCARTRPVNDLDTARQLRHFLDSAVALSTQPPCPSNTPLQDLESTLIAGVHAATHGHAPLETLLAWTREKGEAAQPMPYITDVYNYQQSRCFFTTFTGRIGIGPDYLAEGDTIAVLTGIEWPLALRRIDDETELYILLGPCYVHGVMQGEAVAKHDEEGLLWRWFHLV
nr:hypothetical protein B0A51_02290 [Rachicladosporium sp. CCFEE 5018]